MEEQLGALVWEREELGNWKLLPAMLEAHDNQWQGRGRTRGGMMSTKHVLASVVGKSMW